MVEPRESRERARERQATNATSETSRIIRAQYGLIPAQMADIPAQIADIPVCFALEWFRARYGHFRHGAGDRVHYLSLGSTGVNRGTAGSPGREAGPRGVGVPTPYPSPKTKTRFLAS